MTQRRALATRAGLVDAAATEFARNGYGGSSTNRIPDIAGSTKGAMYFHFESKRDLADAVLDAAASVYSTIGEQWSAEDGVHPIAAIASMVADAAHAFDHNPAVRAEARLSLEPEFADRDPVAGWEDAVADLANKADELGCLASYFTVEKFARVLATGLAGQRYMALVMPFGEAESIWGRYDEFLDAVLAAAVPGEIGPARSAVVAAKISG